MPLGCRPIRPMAKARAWRASFSNGSLWLCILIWRSAGAGQSWNSWEPAPMKGLASARVISAEARCLSPAHSCHWTQDSKAEWSRSPNRSKRNDATTRNGCNVSVTRSQAGQGKRKVQHQGRGAAARSGELDSGMCSAVNVRQRSLHALCYSGLVRS